MKAQRTLGQYRAMDLVFFAALLVLSEWLMVNAAQVWFPAEPYTVSCVGAIVAIVMMRWGVWGLVHAALGGLIFCVSAGAVLPQYIIYIAGNLLSGLALLLRRHLTPEGVRQDGMRTVLFGLSVILLMQLGRGLISLPLGGNRADFLRFFTTDIITVLFTCVVVWVARHQNGLFEDQLDYLHRLQAEQEKERENAI